MGERIPSSSFAAAVLVVLALFLLRYSLFTETNERKWNADRRISSTCRAAGTAAHPSLDAHAYRRPTAALPWGLSIPQVSTPGHASGDLDLSAAAVTIPIPGAEATQFLRALPAFTCPRPASTSQPGL